MSVRIADPQPWTREERLALAEEITARLRTVHGSDLLAVGVYGSTARGTDGPYSDLEMWCVLRADGVDYSHEWTHGPWKAEVDVRGRDVILREAAEVEGRWPITHGAFQVVLPTHDPEGFFLELRRVATSQPDERFREALRGVVVGEIYEDVAKVRNALSVGHLTAPPWEAMELATYGAYAVGLANRQCFTTGTRRIEEALALDDRPEGYARLAELVLTGALAEPAVVAEAIERFWESLVPWVESKGITLADTRRIPS